MVLNNGIAPCGTMSRCCCCNMRLICAKSPYCVINSGSGSSDKKLEEIENLIQQLIQSQAQAIADFETKATAAQASLNTITANIATLQTTSDNLTTTFSEFAQDTKTKLDEIYAKVENIPAASTTSINDLDTPIDVDSSDVSEDDSKSLAVLKPKETEDTILVEKKGLFGKSKWVEQKK